MSTATATNPNDPIAEVARRVDEIVAQGILNEGAARMKVMRADPKLRDRYVIAFNAKHGRFEGGLRYARRVVG